LFGVRRADLGAERAMTRALLRERYAARGEIRVGLLGSMRREYSTSELERRGRGAVA
jgi:hypothetical protein